MSVVVILTHTEARLLYAMCFEPNLRAKLGRLIAADILPDDCAPKTVWLRDEGDGIRLAAVTYDNEAAADQAWEAMWAELQGHEVPAAWSNAPRQGPEYRPARTRKGRRRM